MPAVLTGNRQGVIGTFEMLVLVAGCLLSLLMKSRPGHVGGPMDAQHTFEPSTELANLDWDDCSCGLLGNKVIFINQDDMEITEEDFLLGPPDPGPDDDEWDELSVSRACLACGTVYDDLDQAEGVVKYVTLLNGVRVRTQAPWPAPPRPTSSAS